VTIAQPAPSWRVQLEDFRLPKEQRNKYFNLAMSLKTLIACTKLSDLEDFRRPKEQRNKYFNLAMSLKTLIACTKLSDF